MRNEDIRQELKVAELREKIQECRLRWKRTSLLGHGQWSAGNQEQGGEDAQESDGWTVFGMIWTKLMTE